MFEYFDNKFTNSSLKVKIELYIFPILVLYFVYYFFLTNNLQTLEISSKLDKNDYINKKFKGSFYELFLNIEEYAQKNEIFINSINREKNNIKIKGTSTQNKIIFFINYIEDINNFTKIDILNLKSTNNLDEYIFDLNINLNKFYIKKNQNQKKISEEVKISLPTNKIKKEKFKLNAIIEDYVFINDRWIKKNEFIEDYELVEINRNSILLKNKNDTLILELLDEKYLEKLN